jgi:hypothetical protein
MLAQSRTLRELVVHALPQIATALGSNVETMHYTQIGDGTAVGPLNAVPGAIAQLLALAQSFTCSRRSETDPRANSGTRRKRARSRVAGDTLGTCRPHGSDVAGARTATAEPEPPQVESPARASRNLRSARRSIRHGRPTTRRSRSRHAVTAPAHMLGWPSCHALARSSRGDPGRIARRRARASAASPYSKVARGELAFLVDDRRRVHRRERA